MSYSYDTKHFVENDLRRLARYYRDQGVDTRAEVLEGWIAEDSAKKGLGASITHGEVISAPSIILKGDPADVLKKVAKECQKNPYSPELVADFWKKFWSVPRGKDRVTFAIPDSVFNWTRSEMEEPVKGIQGNFYPGIMVVIPEVEELRGREGLILAGKMWPNLNCWALKSDTTVSNEYEAYGLIKVEASVVSPNLNARASDLFNLINETQRGQRLITYIIASQASRLINRSYFDKHNSYSRLLGSRFDEYYIPHAYLAVGSALAINPSGIDPEFHDSQLGGRCEVIKRAA